MSSSIAAALAVGQLPPDVESARTAGRELAREVCVPRLGATSAAVTVEALVHAGMPRLAELGVRATVVRSRPGCVVVRSSTASGAEALHGCAFVAAWLESLPRVAHRVQGTVVESSCLTRGSTTCIHTLLWQLPEGAAAGTTAAVATAAPTAVAPVSGAPVVPAPAVDTAPPSEASPTPSGAIAAPGTAAAQGKTQRHHRSPAPERPHPAMPPLEDSWVRRANEAFGPRPGGASPAGAPVDAPPAGVASAPPAGAAPSASQGTAPSSGEGRAQAPSNGSAATTAAWAERAEPARPDAQPRPAVQARPGAQPRAHAHPRPQQPVVAPAAVPAATVPTGSAMPSRVPVGTGSIAEVASAPAAAVAPPQAGGAPPAAARRANGSGPAAGKSNVATSAVAVPNGTAATRPALTPGPPAGSWVGAGPAGPMRPAPTGRRWAWARRRAWLLALGLVAGAAGGYYASSHHATSYSATAVLVVRSGASPTGPGGANEAEALAVTDAAVMPNDQTVVGQVGAQLHAKPSVVSSSMSVQAEAGTALMDVRYSAATPAKAIEGVNAIAAVVAGPRVNDQAIASGSVAVVSRAKAASKSGTLTKEGLPLGAVLGLLLGAGAALAAERADRRVDEAETLGDATGTPVTVVPGGISPAELSRALQRSAMGGSCALVPLRGTQVEPAGQLAREVTAARRAAEGKGSATPIGVTVPFADAPDAVCSGDGPTVLVVGAGERARTVSEVVDRLRMVDRQPVWSVLVTSR